MHRSQLIAALTVLGQSLVADRSIKFHSESEGEPKVLHPVVREEAFRIGAEALTNAFNHAKASSIELEIRYGTAALSLLVRDDGIGVEESALVETGRADHFGLVGMRERAAKIRTDISRQQPMCRLQTIGGALRRRHAKRSPHHRLLLSPHDSGVRDFDCRFNLETYRRRV